jgi:hypothetical protein
LTLVRERLHSSRSTVNDCYRFHLTRCRMSRYRLGTGVGRTAPTMTRKEALFSSAMRSTCRTPTHGQWQDPRRFRGRAGHTMMAAIAGPANGRAHGRVPDQMTGAMGGVTWPPEIGPARPHRGIGLDCPDGRRPLGTPSATTTVRRRDLLGGLIHEYELAA